METQQNNKLKEIQPINKPEVITPKNKTRTGLELTTDQKKSDFLEAFVQNTGLKFKTCAQIGIRYSTLRKWLKDPNFKQRLDETQEQVNEIVEQSLISKFDTQSPVPEIFYLRSRDPRYSQRVDIQGNEDKPIVITHNEDTLKLISKGIMEALNRE